jgi:tetratricopeptide (TPR) repeat protein
MGPVAQEIDAPADVQPLQAARPDGTCQRCGAPGARRAEFMRVMSFIVLTRHTKYEAHLCPACSALTGAKELAISCALGWWGIPWGLMTFGAIWTNGRSLLASNLAGRLAAVAILSGVLWGGSALVNQQTESGRERANAKATGNWVDDATAEEYARATELVDAGRLDAALVPLRRAHQSAPDSAAINALYGYVELMLGHPDKALPLLQTARRMDPQNFDALHMLAAAHMQLGDPAKSADCLKQWLALAGEDVTVHEQYQDASIAAGRRAAMVAVYKQGAVRDPQSAEAQYLYGRVLGVPDEVAPLMQRALELDPALQSARELLIHALIGRRELSEAEAELARYEPADPADPKRELFAAMVAFTRKDVEGALVALDEVIESGKGHPMLYFMRAQYAGAAQRFDEARSDLQLARAGAALDPALQLHIAVQEITLLVEEGRFEEASRAIQAAREEHRRIDRVEQLEIVLLDGLVAWQQGDLARAAEVLGAAPKSEQQSMSWRSTSVARGMVLALRGELDGARKVWAEVASAPSEGEDWEQVPTAKLLLSQISPVDYLEQVRRSTPTFDNNAHFAVGLRHELDGRTDDARASYQAAVDTSYGRNHPCGLARAALERLSGASPR